MPNNRAPSESLSQDSDPFSFVTPPGQEKPILEAPVKATDPQANPIPHVDLTPPDDDNWKLSDAERMDLALGTTEQPMSKNLVAVTRVGLEDLSMEEQLDLARQAHEIIGKASGFLPDFASLTENMKAGYLKIVRDIYLSAQRKVRGYNE
jgi:hypothetical protein